MSKELIEERKFCEEVALEVGVCCLSSSELRSNGAAVLLQLSMLLSRLMSCGCFDRAWADIAPAKPRRELFWFKVSTGGQYSSCGSGLEAKGVVIFEGVLAVDSPSLELFDPNNILAFFSWPRNVGEEDCPD